MAEAEQQATEAAAADPVFKRMQLNLDSDSDDDDNDDEDEVMGGGAADGVEQKPEDDGGKHPPHESERDLEDAIFGASGGGEGNGVPIEGEDILLAQLLALYNSRKPDSPPSAGGGKTGAGGGAGAGRGGGPGSSWEKLCAKLRRVRERLIQVKKGAPPSTAFLVDWAADEASAGTGLAQRKALLRRFCVDLAPASVDLWNAYLEAGGAEARREATGMACLAKADPERGCEVWEAMRTGVGEGGGEGGVVEQEQLDMPLIGLEDLPKVKVCVYTGL